MANKIVSELPPLTSENIEQTSFLEELWEIEGQPETLSITSENVTELLEDEKTTKYIINKNNGRFLSLHIILFVFA